MLPDRTAINLICRLRVAPALCCWRDHTIRALNFGINILSNHTISFNPHSMHEHFFANMDILPIWKWQSICQRMSALGMHTNCSGSALFYTINGYVGIKPCPSSHEIKTPNCLVDQCPVLFCNFLLAFLSTGIIAWWQEWVFVSVMSYFFVGFPSTFQL